jgi:hypothetical protein
MPIPLQLYGGAVNNRSMPTRNANLSAMPNDFQERCSRAVDQAIGNENSSLPSKAKASWFALFKAAAHAVGFYVGVHRSWLALPAPHASSRMSTGASNAGNPSRKSPDDLAHSMDVAIGPQPVAALKSTAASRSVTIAQPQPTPDDLAYSMDIAIGARFTVQSRTVENSSGQAPAAELPESSKGLAKAAKAGN